MNYKPKFAAKSIKLQPMPMAALIANLKTLPTQLSSDEECNGGSPDESSGSFTIPKTPATEKKPTLLAESALYSLKENEPIQKETIKKNIATNGVRRELSLYPKETRPESSCTKSSTKQSCTKQNITVQDTPSQPEGNKNRKIQFKTLGIKGKKYMVIKRLGTGGSSEVFKVMELNTSVDYAVKCVDLATDRETVRGYLNEVRILKELQQSDRVIKLYDFEHDKGNMYLRLLLELGETDLASFMKTHRPAPSTALVLHYWEEMLRAVQHIHQHGIVHADLKPANFLLVSGRLKLIDFGIASAVSGEATSVERSSGKGTFSYISPEAIGGAGDEPNKVSFYSDVWSLGCILYSMVYGNTPFAHLPTMVKLATIRDPTHVIEYPPADKYPHTLLTSMKECLRYAGHARPTVNELLRVNHLRTEAQGLPTALLSKIHPHVTEKEFALIRSAKIDLVDHVYEN